MRFGRWAAFALVFTLLVSSAGCSNQHPATIAENVTVPDFTLKDLDGNNVSLSQFRGDRPVLIAFWATWCDFCKEEIPDLTRLQNELGDRLKILAIDIQESAIKVAPLVKARGINYTVLLDEEGEVSSAYGVVGIPTLVLVDKEGVGVAAENGLSARLLHAIEKLIAPPSVSAAPAS